MTGGPGGWCLEGQEGVDCREWRWCCGARRGGSGCCVGVEEVVGVVWVSWLKAIAE